MTKTNKRLIRKAFLAQLVAVLVMPVVAARAADAPSGIDKLLAKVKADHPNARILKVEEVVSGADRLYEVKLFPPDGRILKLVYDARTLAFVEAIGGHDGGPQRRCARHGWHGGMGH